VFAIATEIVQLSTSEPFIRKRITTSQWCGTLN